MADMDETYVSLDEPGGQLAFYIGLGRWADAWTFHQQDSRKYQDSEEGLIRGHLILCLLQRWEEADEIISQLIEINDSPAMFELIAAVRIQCAFWA